MPNLPVEYGAFFGAVTVGTFLDAFSFFFLFFAFLMPKRKLNLICLTVSENIIDEDEEINEKDLNKKMKQNIDKKIEN